MRGLEALEFDDDVARAAFALDDFKFAATGKKLAAVLLDRLGRLRGIELVGIEVVHRDAADDIGFGHGLLLTG